jgi:hypothetical protein
MKKLIGALLIASGSLVVSAAYAQATAPATSPEPAAQRPATQPGTAGAMDTQRDAAQDRGATAGQAGVGRAETRVGPADRPADTGVGATGATMEERERTRAARQPKG